MGLTVAVTGPTGDIGRALLRTLERAEAVERVLGMARRPFDPAGEGLAKAEYRRGDVLDRGAVGDLVAGADVVVHLAFSIMGGGEEARRVNLEGSRNVFAATAGSGARRLVYTSSVAAYGFHEDNPRPVTEDIPVRGSAALYYSAQKAELEAVLSEVLGDAALDAYVLRPCIVAGPDALALVETLLRVLELGGRVPLARALDRLPLLAPVLPDPGTAFQLVHHDDVAQALLAAIEGRGDPGAYNLAAPGTLRARDLARELGWRSVPVPGAAVETLARAISRVPGLPPEASWLHACRVPVLMDCRRARAELGWWPRRDARTTLRETVAAARLAGLLGPGR